MANKCNNRQITDPNSIPIDSVLWTGINLDCFDICNGDSITPLMEAIANRVCELLETTDVTSTVLCESLIQELGSQDKTIGTLLQILSTEACTLRELIEDIQEQLGTSTSLTLDFKCVSTSDACGTTNPDTLQGILQLIINSFCTLKDQFDEITENIGDTINNSIEAYLDNLFTTALPNRIIKQNTNPASYKFRGFIPPNCPIEYYGSLTHFDSSGKGLDIMDGWYLCNGNNGTIDKRGTVAVCAIQGMGGGGLQSYVNPASNPATPSANYSIGDRGGSVSVSLSLSQIPNHNHNISHTISQNPHTHTMTFQKSGNGGGGSDAAYNSNFGSTTDTLTTSASNADISISSTIGFTGGNQAHENRMPYIACAYIQMID